MRLLQELHEKQRITIVLITHEPDIAAYGTRIIAVRDGVIISDRRDHLLALKNGAGSSSINIQKYPEQSHSLIRAPPECAPHHIDSSSQ